MTSLTLAPLAAWLRATDLTPELAQRLEDLGYDAVWLGGSPGDLDALAPALEATNRIVLATGIVNIWASPADEVAQSALRLLDRFPDRFILGVGVGHPERFSQASRPLEGMSRYLDVLDAQGVPSDRIVLAALGDKMLRIAAERSAGAHPYLTTPEHTRHAREVIGPDALLIPEQRVVFRTDAAGAYEFARPSVAHPYLRLANYVRNLRNLGFSEEDLAGEGSDALIDALVAWGDDAQIAERLGAHLSAGANQVAVQLLGPADELDAGYARVAGLLGLERA